MSSPYVKDVTVTVIYDNNVYKRGLQAAWGFSCLVKGTEKTILFDTGGNGLLLMQNMKHLEIDPMEIDVVVLSHIHGDHVGGLNSFLRSNHEVIVYMPTSFPNGFKESVKGHKAKSVEVKNPLSICEHVYSTGELGTRIKEQSLIIHTSKGLVVITGCAHPGIVEIVDKAKQLTKDQVLLVVGGFHLAGESESRIEDIVESLKKMGVHYAGPCHCSGDKARELFKKEYNEDFIDVGVGRIIATDSR